MIAYFSRRLMRILAPLAFAVLGCSNAAAQPAYDYCGFPGARTHVFLLDRTAGYGDEDLRRLDRGMRMWLAETVRTGDRLVVQAVTDYVATAEVLMNACVPGCPPKDRIAWYDSCNIDAVERDQIMFRRSLGTVFDPKILEAGTRKEETALVEILFTAIQQFKPNTLTIFSDFLEHHPRGQGAVNFYQPSNLTVYMKYLREARLIPNLKDVEIAGFGLGKDIGSRPRKVTEAQWANVYKFWVKYLTEAGATGFSLAAEYRGRALPPEALPPPAAIRAPPG